MLTEPKKTISVLSDEAISQIAAGELIDRPCAVVKELIENSIDAGSSAVTVDVVDGGKHLIRVADDGEGIPPEDIRVAFERHATSKLRTLNDLWHVRTMGFRGEALPSISSVSKVKIRTMSRGRKVGAELTLTNGLPGVLEDTAMNQGTIIEAADIFFNAPVRKKYLKTTPTEFSHICRIVQHQALGAPSIHLKLTHNGKLVSDFPAALNMRDRVLQIFGEKVVDRSIEISKTYDDVEIWGLFCQPELVKTSRTPQEIILNGRWIKNATIVHAVYESYRMKIPRDRHPTFIMTAKVDPIRVDVNIHPTKREVRFLNQEEMHRAVFHALKYGLGTSPNVAQSISAGHAGSVDLQPLNVSETLEENGKSEIYQLKTPLRDVSDAGQSVLEMPDSLDSTVHASLNIDSCSIEPLGQLNATYVIAHVDTGSWNGLQVVDQHTAHERVLFDRLVTQVRTNSVSAQVLLLSRVIELQPFQAVALNEHLDAIRNVGLEIEQFGRNAFRICSVPAFLASVDVEQLLQEIVEEIIDTGTYAGSSEMESLDKRTYKVLATMACHGAVKANQLLGREEIKHLVHEWTVIGMPTTCPHGRRIVMSVSMDELNRIFGRA